MRISNNCFKKIISSLLLIGIFVSIFALVSPTANAYETWNGSKMINGVGQSGNRTRYYWYDTDTLTTAWRRRINNGMTAWCNTGSQGCGVYTSVWMQRTTTKSSSVIDFYNTNLGDRIYGMASFYTGTGTNSTEIFPYNDAQNWVWAKIELNETFSDDSETLTSAQKLVMVEHEIGHSFGLAHVSGDLEPIMCPYVFLCTSTEPTADDCNGVNSLYGGYNP